MSIAPSKSLFSSDYKTCLFTPWEYTFLISLFGLILLFISARVTLPGV